MKKVNESQKRPREFYIKLESDTPIAMTWHSGKDKLVKLFKSHAEAFIWQHSEQGKAIAANGYKLKLEDGYIFKPKGGLVYEYGNGNQLVYDCYIGGPNQNSYVERIVANEKLLNNRRSASDAIRKNTDRLKEIEDQLEALEIDVYDIINDYRKRCSHIDNLIQIAIGKNRSK